MHLLYLKKQKEKKKNQNGHGEDQFKNGQDQKQIMGTFSYPPAKSRSKTGLGGQQTEEAGTLRGDRLVIY